ncbi:MAG: guanitoxin biosynthesis MBL fold metallo-hydrolase GntH [Planctomycetota bacterium]|jgi:ribonuclease Z
MKKLVSISSIVLVLAGFIVGCVVSQSSRSLVQDAEAAGGKVLSPVSAAPGRYAYYPGTEELGSDEMRVIACGTGMPAARHGQAATSFLVELGNGDKFLFDIGTHSMGNTASLMIPYDFLDKVFISHLHTDHWGDLATLWAGGWTAGRTEALKVWGPSGAVPEMGTKYAVEHFMKTYNWDYQTRLGALADEPGQIRVTEFDYKGENIVVYNQNGVTIRSWPAIHSGDGSISYSLEWNGYKFVFGGDTYPNKWFIKYAQNADLAIHECFHLPEQMVKMYNQAPPVALYVATKIHTSPQAFGKIMSTIKPKHAVAYHFFTTDLMTWNITRKGVEERMATVTEEAWSVDGPVPAPDNEPDDDPMKWMSKEILSGEWDVRDAEGPMIKAYMQKYKLDPAMFAPKQ